MKGFSYVAQIEIDRFYVQRFVVSCRRSVRLPARWFLSQRKLWRAVVPGLRLRSVNLFIVTDLFGTGSTRLWLHETVGTVSRIGDALKKS